MKHTEIRKRFLDFFKSKGHTVVPSDSLVPAGDPTLLFTTAGMNQFKERFLGNIKGFIRATSCQKCLRTGDLENVGRTTYHHTFFEMLGNFSFGDYFKEEAIRWAWEFMRNTLKIPEAKLLVSVYEEDDETYSIWKDIIKVPSQKIIALGAKENFWPSEARDKGPNGPCGPCSEIFYDYGQNVGCRRIDCTPICNCGRFVEVWNLVFTQFNRREAGILELLPSKNIDTGMGLERLCAVMQGVMSSFDTDLFMPIIKTIRDEISQQPNQPSGTADRKLWANNINAIADHIRAVSFAICDGITPSNEERGYVIRKLINKAAMHGRNLEIDKPFLYRLVYAVAKVMEEPYPEVLKRHQDIAEVIKFEEERFSATLKGGLRLLQEVIADTKKSARNIISGEDAFRLFDTHGLQLVMMKEVVAKEGLSVDEKRFEELLQAQRERSRRASKIHGSVFVESIISEKTEFIGYDKAESEAKIVKILKDGKPAEIAEARQEVEIILDKSVFYGESGGQIGDTGELLNGNAEAEVRGAKRESNAIILSAVIKKGKFATGDIIQSRIDLERRLAIAKNHTATHLLQAALRKILGEHVQQQGSLVAPERLRFDFTHFKALTDDEIKRIENLVNQYIKEANSISATEMALDEARRSGALAFFGDKYEQNVRVIDMAGKSKELCGGTHLKNTNEIGLFKIMKEGSVASGIRRIEACTSDAALGWIKEDEKAAKEREVMLRKREQDKDLAKRRLRELEKGIDAIIEKAERISDTELIITRVDDTGPDGLKHIADIIRMKLPSFLVLLVSKTKGKLNILISASDDVVKKGIDADRLIAQLTKPIGGCGGGKPNMALGGAKDTGKSDYLLKEAKIYVKHLFGNHNELPKSP